MERLVGGYSTLVRYPAAISVATWDVDRLPSERPFEKTEQHLTVLSTTLQAEEISHHRRKYLEEGNSAKVMRCRGASFGRPFERTAHHLTVLSTTLQAEEISHHRRKYFEKGNSAISRDVDELPSVARSKRRYTT